MAESFYDLRVSLFGVNFHLFTALVIIITGVIVWFMLRKLSFLNRAICTMATLAFTVHIYEVFHAMAQYEFMGYTGIQSLLVINIPSVILSHLILRHYGKITPNPISVFASLLGLSMSLQLLGFENFFQTYDYNSMWAMSKVMASLTGLALVEKYGTMVK